MFSLNSRPCGLYRNALFDTRFKFIKKIIVSTEQSFFYISLNNLKGSVPFNPESKSSKGAFPFRLTAYPTLAGRQGPKIIGPCQKGNIGLGKSRTTRRKSLRSSLTCPNPTKNSKAENKIDTIAKKALATSCVDKNFK